MPEFRRDLLPSAHDYFGQVGLTPSGRGKWVTTRCEFHGGSDSMRWNTEAGTWVCMSCGAKGDVIDYHMQLLGIGFKDAARQLGALDGAGVHLIPARPLVAASAQQQEEEWARALAANKALWNEALPVRAGDPVALYLKRRGLAFETFPGCLRFHPELPYWEDGQRTAHPAMLAPIRHASGRMVALHRTYLTADGSKAAVSKPKKLTRTSGLLAGAAIWLGGLRAMLHASTIAVAEGIETALACMLTSGVPAAAATSAGMLQQFVWPEAARSLVVFADNDENGTGQDAGRKLVERAVTGGVEARLLIPEQVGADWADVRVAAQKEVAA